MLSSEVLLRNWLKAIGSRLTFARQKTLSLIADWLTGALWLIDATYIALARKAYGGNAVAYACVRLLSQSVPEAPCRSYQEGKDGKRTELPKPHPLVQLIAHPNELQTEYEFWELTTAQLAIAGNSYWWKQRANTGAPIALWPLRPDRVGPIYSDSDKPGERLIIGYSYQDPGTGQYVPIARRDVIAFNLPNPAGESGGIVEGLGPLQVLASEISADNEATNFVGALVRNYAAPNLVVTTKYPVNSEEEANLIKAQVRAQFAGAKRGEIALLDNDAKLEMLGFNLQQLEFPDLRAIAESRIAAAVGVPAALVGLKVGLDKMTYSNLSEARAFFAETTLSNYWRRYGDQLTNDLATEYGEGIVCEFDTSGVRALAGQRVEKVQPVKEAFSAGAATRNEYRDALGLEPDPNGDVYLVPNTLTEVPKLDHVKPEPEPMTTLPASPSPEGSLPLAPGSEPVVPSEKMPVGKSALRLAADPEDMLNEAQAADEKRLQIALQVMLDDLLGDVTASIMAGEVVTDAMLEAKFVAVLKAELVKTVRSQLLGVATQVGVHFDPAVMGKLASEWAQTYSYGLVKGLTETTRGVIAGAVSDYMATPAMTMEQLRAALEPAFGAVRAQAIATTETTRAWQAGVDLYSQQLRDQYGLDTDAVWFTQADERVCPLCGPWNGKSERLWRVEHPSGPPIHPWCRCRTVLQAKKPKVGT